VRVALLQFAFLAVFVAIPCSAQESPFFVTYTHHMEEPGNLEIETSSTIGIPRSGQKFYAAPYMEVEYGLTAQWTTELYLETSSVWGDSTVFTGWRFENRYKPLKREHWINPVLYLEFENVNEASRIQKEIEGGGPDLISSNRELRGEHAHELETKLILSSDVHDWNISENFIAGIEMYGGLGSTLDGFSARGTAHYIAPVVSWAVSDNATLRLSTGFGLTDQSNPVLLRIGYSYELAGFGSRVSRLFGVKR